MDISKYKHLVWCLIVAMILLTIGEFFGLFLIIPFSFLYSLFDTRLVAGFLGLFYFLGISIVVFLKIKFLEKKPISYIGFSRENVLKKYSIGFLVGFVLMSAIVGILFILQTLSINDNSVQPVGRDAIFNIIIILFGWIIQGAAEEILTRGWLLSNLRTKYSDVVSVFASASFFGFLHIFNLEVDILAIINIILFGAFAGMYVIKTNDLWGVCGMHSAWNFVQGNIFGFEVSGSSISIGTLIDFESSGKILLNGGAFGPESGMICTLVLIIAIILIESKEIKRV
jgi:hypothetical protein